MKCSENLNVGGDVGVMGGQDLAEDFDVNEKLRIERTERDINEITISNKWTDLSHSKQYPS